MLIGVRGVGEFISPLQSNLYISVPRLLERDRKSTFWKHLLLRNIFSTTTWRSD
jgi:hypothetical protein